MVKGVIQSSIILLLLVTFSLFITSNASADTIYYPSGKTNGYKVYLSPANHNPEKIGCNNYKESENALKIATETAKDLQAMGYTVRVGSGDYITNTNSSNSWGPNLHVPIHSNATTFDCQGTNSQRGGTWLMYYGSEGSTAADKLLAAMQSGSPGTNDKKYTDVEATGGSLYELRETNAIAAYVEAAFHTYGPDVNWLLQQGTVGQRITNGIHNYSGANDCRFETCAILTRSIDGLVVEAEEVNVEKDEDIKFDINSHGKRHISIEEDLNKLLEGTNTSSVFSESTSGMLNGVSIDDNGTLIVDFKNFSEYLGSSSTYLTGQLHKELNEIVFKYPEVNEVYYLFDGNFSDWSYWLELVEESIKRN